MLVRPPPACHFLAKSRLRISMESGRFLWQRVRAFLMHLAIIVIVVCALASGESGSPGPTAAPQSRVALTVAGMLLVVLLARIAAGATALGLLRNGSRRTALLRRFRKWRLAHAALWFATSLTIVFALDWAAVVRGDLDVQGMFLVDELLILAPILVPLVASWAAFYEVHRVALQQNAAAAGNLPRVMTRRAFVGLQVRHYLGLIFIPLFAVLACRDLLEFLVPDLAAGPRDAAVLLCLLSVIAIYPWLLRMTWRTERLPAGKLRDRLESINATGGVQVRDILLWRCGGMISNAAVAGVLPGLRYVFLSDGLLLQMTEDQIAAVYAHEVGHVRYRHTTLRLLALAAAVVVWQMTAGLFPGANWLDFPDGMPAPMVGICVVAMLVLAAALVAAFSTYCRALELQADLSACATDAPPRGRLKSTDAPKHISSALAELHAAAGTATSGLFHPSVGRRIAFVSEMAGEHRAIERFHRRLSNIARAWLLIVLLGAAYWLLPF